MQRIVPALQIVVLALACVAAVPFIANQRAVWNARNARAALALRHAAVGRVALDGGDPELAARAFSAALEVDNERPELRQGLLEAHVQQTLKLTGTLSEADALRLQEEFAAAISSSDQPGAPLLTAYGKLLLARGDNLGARKQLERAVAADPKFAPAYLTQGVTFYRAHELAPAADALQKALSLENGMPQALYTLGQVRSEEKKWDEAVAALDAASQKLTDDAGVFLALGKALLEARKTPEAEVALQKALSLRADLVQAHAPLGRALLANHKDGLAADQLDQAWKLAGDRDAYLLLAQIYERGGQLDAAARAWSELAQLDPENPEPHFHIALLAEQRGDTDLEARALRFALDRAAQDADKNPEHEKLALSIRGRLEALKSTMAKPDKPHPKK